MFFFWKISFFQTHSNILLSVAKDENPIIIAKVNFLCSQLCMFKFNAHTTQVKLFVLHLKSFECDVIGR